MAKLVLGIGSSNGPLLKIPPEQWDLRVPAERQQRHAYREGDYRFDELARMRAVEQLERQSSLPVRRQRQAACNGAVETLARVFAEVHPDVAVIIGNEQMEIFDDANMPAFLAYYGETLENIPHNADQRNRLPPGGAAAEHGYHGRNTETYPGAPELAHHLIGTFIDKHIDVSVSNRLADIPGALCSGLPPAYGFVYKQILREHAVPAVPIVLNTHYPPNQPHPQRCFALGRAIAEAIASWDKDLRVAVVASGGMSHWVIDEALDRGFIGAIQQRNKTALLEFPNHYYRSGSSELKTWITLAASMLQTELEMTLVNYQACYRSNAGTGAGMAFAYWR